MEYNTNNIELVRKDKGFFHKVGRFVKKFDFFGHPLTLKYKN